MTAIHHLNCGTLQAPGGPAAACHCLLLVDRAGLALIDTGIGLADVRDPAGRIGPELIANVGWQFDERATALRQLETLGYSAQQVRHIVLTHADPDHAGGLTDFPHAQVHLAARELAELGRGDRYLPVQFAHDVAWRPCAAFGRDWFGLPAAELPLAVETTVLLVALPGHTHGHCGVAVRDGRRWLLHAGDAYYLRVELETDGHPVSALAAARADDDPLRRATLEHLIRLSRDCGDEITLFGYHDFSEFPAARAASKA